jgi:hypothetical protein
VLWLRCLADAFDERSGHLLYCIQRWIGLVLDLIVAGIAVIVVAVAISMKGHLKGATEVDNVEQRDTQ